MTRGRRHSCAAAGILRGHAEIWTRSRHAGMEAARRIRVYPSNGMPFRASMAHAEFGDSVRRRFKELLSGLRFQVSWRIL